MIIQEDKEKSYFVSINTYLKSFYNEIEIKMSGLIKATLRKTQILTNAAFVVDEDCG